MLSVELAKSTMSRKQVQLWYNRLKESRENVNDNACPGRPSTSTTLMLSPLNQWRKWFWIIVVSLFERLRMMMAYCSAYFQAISTCVLSIKRAAAKIVPKLLNLGHRLGDVNNVQRRSRFAQIVHNCWRFTGVSLWNWNQSPIIPMEASSHDRKKHLKFGQM